MRAASNKDTMKKRIKAILFATFLISNLSAQNNSEIYQFTLDLDSSYLFIDNSPHCWYTIELQTDTIIAVEETIYFINGKTFQIISVPFDNGKPNGVKGSIKEEEYALLGHKKWELDYQKKALRKRLKNDDEKYYNKNGKPFLIWWYKTPQKSKVPIREIEVQTERSIVESFDTSVVELDVTHQLYLDFIIHGYTSVSFSIPVLETELLDEEKQKLKKIANTLNVYGSYIDLKLLVDRTKNSSNYIFRDSLNLIEIKLPDWLNVLQSPYDKTLVASFPEKENIYNAVGISWEPKVKDMDLKEFVKSNQKNRSYRNDVKIITDCDTIIRESYTRDNTYFYCQDIYLESDNLYCYINYTATKTTYNYNLDRLNELINSIKLK